MKTLFPLSLNNLKTLGSKPTSSFFSPERNKLHPLEQNAPCSETRGCRSWLRERTLRTGFCVLLSDIISPAPGQTGREQKSQAITSVGGGLALPAVPAPPRRCPGNKERRAARPRPAEHQATTSLARPLQAPNRLRLGQSRPRAGINGTWQPVPARAPALRGYSRGSSLGRRLLLWPLAQPAASSPGSSVPGPSQPRNPELRPRRYHGASFLPAPSHGPRHKTTWLHSQSWQSRLTPRGLHPLRPPRSQTARCRTAPAPLHEGPRPATPRPGARRQDSPRAGALRSAARRRRPGARPQDARARVSHLGSGSPTRPPDLAGTNLASPGCKTSIARPSPSAGLARVIPFASSAGRGRAASARPGARLGLVPQQSRRAAPLRSPAPSRPPPPPPRAQKGRRQGSRRAEPPK